jgi:hypothetical protein
MSRNEQEVLAAKRADQYTPKPPGGLFMAGICGFVAALLGDVVASRFYGWPVRDHIKAAVLVALAGFLIGIFVNTRSAHRSRKARQAELAKIDHSAE